MRETGVELVRWCAGKASENTVVPLPLSRSEGNTFLSAINVLDAMRLSQPEDNTFL